MATGQAIVASNRSHPRRRMTPGAVAPCVARCKRKYWTTFGCVHATRLCHPTSRIAVCPRGRDALRQLARVLRKVSSIKQASTDQRRYLVLPWESRESLTTLA